MNIEAFTDADWTRQKSDRRFTATYCHGSKYRLRWAYWSAVKTICIDCSDMYQSLDANQRSGKKKSQKKNSENSEHKIMLQFNIIILLLVVVTKIGAYWTATI